MGDRAFPVAGSRLWNTAERRHLCSHIAGSKSHRFEFSFSVN